MTVPPNTGVTLIVGFVALLLLGLWSTSGRLGRLRPGMVRNYANESAPIWMRNSLGLAPLWAGCALLFAIAVLDPKALRWLFLAAIALGFVAFCLSYRVPAPFLPGWLREEIDRERVAAARPDRSDWVFFWLVIPVAIVGLPAIVYLILTTAPPTR